MYDGSTCMAGRPSVVSCDDMCRPVVPAARIRRARHGPRCGDFLGTSKTLCGDFFGASKTLPDVTPMLISIATPTNLRVIRIAG